MTVAFKFLKRAFGWSFFHYFTTLQFFPSNYALFMLLFLCRRTVTSVADSVKKFSGAGAAHSPQPSRVSKPKTSPKKPELKPSASPALEAKATPAKTTTDAAKGTPGNYSNYHTVVGGATPGSLKSCC